MHDPIGTLKAEICMETRHVRSAAMLAALVTGSTTVAAQAPRSLPDNVRAALDSALERVTREQYLPGAAFAVVRDGRAVYRRDMGWADREANRHVGPETVFYIASSTKSFTALAAALLAHDHVLSLDAPLSRLLPDARLAPPLSADSVTLRQLLTHTHGISGDGPVSFRFAYSGDYTRDGLLSGLVHHPPAPWGREFRYSNIGYNIAGMAIDAVAAKSWKDVLSERIFAPLAMRNTTGYVSRVSAARLAMPYRPTPDGLARVPYGKGDQNMHAAGGLVTTADDLVRWVAANLGRGVVDGKRVFPAEVMAEAHRLQVNQQPQRADGIERHGYALGWQRGLLDGDTLVHHFGGFPGFAAHISFMPARGTGVIVLSNGGFGPPVQTLLASYAYALVSGRSDDAARYRAQFDQLKDIAGRQRDAIARDLARRTARPQTTAHPLEAYAGTYENAAYGRVEARVEQGRLVVRMGLMSAVAEVFDGTKDQMRVELIPGQGQVITFAVTGDRAESVSSDGQVFARVKR